MFQTIVTSFNRVLVHAPTNSCMYHWDYCTLALNSHGWNYRKKTNSKIYEYSNIFIEMVAFLFVRFSKWNFIVTFEMPSFQTCV